MKESEETHSKQTVTVEGPVDYDYIVTPYQEKIAEICKLPYPIFWFIVSSVLLGTHLFISKKSGAPSKIVWAHVVIGFLPFLLATSTIWFSKMLEDFTPSMFKFIAWPKERIISWNEREIRSIFSNKWMAISGIVFSVFLLPTVPLRPLWPTEIITRISLLSINFVLSFLAGGVAYCMLRILIMVYKLGKIDEIKVSIYQHPVTSVRAIGKLMFRIALTILIIYTFGMSYFVGDNPSILLLFMNLFFGIVVLGFFIYPQINVHKIMSKMKHKRLMRFSSYLEESLQAVTEDPSGANIQRVREMFEIQRSLNGMGEWPFNTKLLLTIITGIAIPILIVLIQIICSKLSK